MTSTHVNGAFEDDLKLTTDLNKEKVLENNNILKIIIGTSDESNSTDLNGSCSSDCYGKIEAIDHPSLRTCDNEIKAVKVNNLSLKFNGFTEKILDNVCLDVPMNVIYGLLGPSACGKTSLLRCLFGAYSSPEGEIKLFNQKVGANGSYIPGRNCGYMPQEVALYHDLTVYDNIYYFGMLNLVDRDTLLKRIDEILIMLNIIEDKKATIRTLSGGQQRRVSFAAALIHEPKLLILDEPTVGVDPMLRSKIWNHLVHLASSKRSTIIITTHYIEEARRADKIAFMRKGKILDEDNPENFLMKFNKTSLEDVFLHLCCPNQLPPKVITHNEVDLDSRNNQFSNQIYDIEVPTKTNPSAIDFKTDLKNWMFMIIALLMKSTLRDLKNPIKFIALYLISTGALIFFSICVGGTPVKIPVGIVNEDKTENGSSLSEIFIEHLSHKITTPILYDNFGDAWTDAKDGNIWGIVRFPSNFSDSFVERLNLYSSDIDNTTLDNSKITLYVDRANKIVSTLTLRYFNYYFQDFLNLVYEDLGENPKLGQIPIQTLNPVYGNIVPSEDNRGYRDSIIPGFIINMIYVDIFTVTMFTLMEEKLSMAFERNFSCGVTGWQIIISYTLNRLVMSIPVVILLIIIPLYVFDVPNLGSVALITILLFLVILAGMSFGIVLAGTFREKMIAMLVGAGAFLCTITISGTIWPLESIPYWFRWFSYIQPTTYPTIVLRCILYKGWGLEKFEVWMGFFVPFLWFIIPVIICRKFFNYQK